MYEFDIKLFEEQEGEYFCIENKEMIGETKVYTFSFNEEKYNSEMNLKENEKTRGDTDLIKENYQDTFNLNESFNERKINDILKNNEFEYEEYENDFSENKNENNIKYNKISNDMMIKFQIETKKIGRKKKEEDRNINQKYHSFNSRDNMIRKIRVYSIKFALNLINNCIKKVFGKKTRRMIRGISKEITSDITIEFNINFFETNLGEIFSNPINEKYKVRDKNQNIKEINKIRKLRNKTDKALLINELLDLKFKDVYDMFVYGDKEENIQKYLKYGKDNNTLNLEELLLSFNHKFNEDYINKLRNEAKNIMSFFNVRNARKLKNNEKKYRNNFQTEKEEI